MVRPILSCLSILVLTNNRLLRSALFVISFHSRYHVRFHSDFLKPSFLTHRSYRACKIMDASCGGVTHFALTPDEDGSVMTVGFGQGAANGSPTYFYGPPQLSN